MKTFAVIFLLSAFLAGIVTGTLLRTSRQNTTGEAPDSFPVTSFPETGSEDPGTSVIPSVTVTPSGSPEVSPDVSQTPAPTATPSTAAPVTQEPAATAPATPTNTATPTPSPTQGIDQSISITAFHYGYSVPVITASPGEVIRVTVSSTGGMHDWGVDEIPGSRTPLIPGGQQRTVTFTVPALASGDYSFYCSVGTHRAQGMEGIFRIE
ncbi:MAG: hypothetical protein TR69_WS6001001332 [candidate division WS6 bacterium OLB20]|uniref:Blue (type 1) copper domain-containing protein n=1 Tax=candidate division WS6 bacterium OLB20 TaxID=1617426 RepID=A0A136LWL7_9BACT|nr:MAG: hypothetical protein TR69_WS6001001332 [candidate division WS6 bacterium OLB20]